MKYEASVKNRLKRIEGQIKAIHRMMEEEKDCSELVIQMSAARSALDRAIGVVVSKNLDHCIRQQIEKGEDTDIYIKEAVDLLVKTR